MVQNVLTVENCWSENANSIPPQPYLMPRWKFGTVLTCPQTRRMWLQYGLDILMITLLTLGAADEFVCPSVTRVIRAQTAECFTNLFMSPDSAWNWLSCEKIAKIFATISLK